MVLAVATFPLIWLGGLVTTYDAGMAVPDWPTTYGYNLFLYPFSTWFWGPWDLFIEHGHRLLASAVGLLTIFTVVVTWRCESRRWVKWFSVACLFLVVFQGVLGGMRVLFDANFVARIHGCVGPLFFAAAVALTCLTSTWWLNGKQNESNSGFARTAWVTTAMAYVQLVLGAHLRHVSIYWSAKVFSVFVMSHLTVAAALLAHCWLMTFRTLHRPELKSVPLVQRPTWLLSGLVTTQLLLGAAAWRVKYNWPDWLPQPTSWRGHAVTAEGMLQSTTVTLHVAVGSLVLICSLVVSLRASRLLRSTGGVALSMVAFPWGVSA